jgi:hypothetical protein
METMSASLATNIDLHFEAMENNHNWSGWGHKGIEM